MSSGGRQTTGDTCRDTQAPRPRYLRERARRREESRLRVEQVALSLFAERGFDAVTVDEICATAGIAVATFYRYFASKEDVFFGYEPMFMEQVVRCAELVDRDLMPAEQVLQFVRAFARFLESQGASLAQRDGMVQEAPTLRARTFAIQREWESLLTRALASRRGRPQPGEDDELDAALCLLVLRGAMRRWRADPDTRLPEAAADVLTELRKRLA